CVGVATVLADFLAVGGVEAGEESVEVGVVTVEPVKLHAVADHEACVCEPVGFVLANEQDVEGGDAAVCSDVSLCARQCLACGVVCAEQAATRDRSEGNGADEVGVVLEAMSGISIGPCPVEDVFAPGVLLEIERKGGVKRTGGGGESQ